jgi:uncharacterized membrane protein YdjX (TVP38/TMEM64 family)
VTGGTRIGSGTRGVVVTLVLTAASIGFVLAVPDLRDALGSALRGDTASLREELNDLGVAGVLVLVTLILVHSVVFFPSEIVNAAAGFVYGFWPAMAILVPAWLASGLLAYWVGRSAGRPVLYRLSGERRFTQAERLIHRGGAIGLLGARLVPVVPYSVVGYVAGAAHVPVFRYAWTSAVGSLPLVAVVTWLGSRLEEISPGSPVVWVTVGVVLALLASGHYFARHFRESHEPDPGEGPGSGDEMSAP